MASLNQENINMHLSFASQIIYADDLFKIHIGMLCPWLKLYTISSLSREKNYYIPYI
jgi:hypothetical protein